MVQEIGRCRMMIISGGRKKAESPEFALYLRKKEKELSGLGAEAVQMLRRVEIALALSGWTMEEKPPLPEFTTFIEDNLDEIDAIDARALEICHSLNTEN
jgi:hypothetical protein